MPSQLQAGSAARRQGKRPRSPSPAPLSRHLPSPPQRRAAQRGAQTPRAVPSLSRSTARPNSRSSSASRSSFSAATSSASSSASRSASSTATPSASSSASRSASSTATPSAPPDNALLLEDIENPFGDNSNLKRVFEAIYSTWPENATKDAAISVWRQFGPDGLVWILLSGVKLAGIWIAIAETGRVRKEDLLGAERVSASHAVVGLYADLGVEGEDPRDPYFGSSHGTTTHGVAGYVEQLLGVAYRVLGQHENVSYRSRLTTTHYEKGYQTARKHFYSLMWGVSPAAFDSLVQPVDYPTHYPKRQGLMGFLEASSITVLGFFKNAASSARLRELNALTATLAPNFASTNRAVGYEITLDLSSDRQADRGRRGAAVSGKTRAKNLNLDPGENISLKKYHELLAPEAARDAELKASENRDKTVRLQQYTALISGTKEYTAKVPGRGQYRLSEGSKLLDTIASRLKRKTVKNVAIPVPNDKIRAENLIGKAIRFTAIGPFTPATLRMQILDEESALVFEYGEDDLPGVSKKGWEVLSEWLQIMMEQAAEETAEEAAAEASS